MWKNKFGEDSRTTATVFKHVWTRNYLNIEQNVIINYGRIYEVEKKANRGFDFKKSTNGVVAPVAPIAPAIIAPKVPTDKNSLLVCNQASLVAFQEGMFMRAKRTSMQYFILLTITTCLRQQPAFMIVTVLLFHVKQTIY